MCIRDRSTTDRDVGPFARSRFLVVTVQPPSVSSGLPVVLVVGLIWQRSYRLSTIFCDDSAFRETQIQEPNYEVMSVKENHTYTIPVNNQLCSPTRSTPRSASAADPIHSSTISGLISTQFLLDVNANRWDYYMVIAGNSPTP